jgi:hypothetical protein
MRFQMAITLVASAAVLAGCKQGSLPIAGSPVVAATNSSPTDAIQTAIQAHLAHNGNLRLDAFDITMKQVTFDRDQAQAQVEFHAKSGAGTMQLTYALSKQAGTWNVIESKPGGSNFSHPPLDRTLVPAASGKMATNSDIFQVLDKVHGVAATPPQTLPPGHPPVATSPQAKLP